MSLDKFTQDGQDPKVVEKIHNKIVDMLIHNEHINYIALQKKPAVTLLPDSISITNKRIFLCEFTKLGLGTNFEIFDWKEIKDIAFKEEIFGSKVTVIPFTGENLSIDYIPKTQARRLYQLIKEVLEEIKNAPDHEVNIKSTTQAVTFSKPESQTPQLAPEPQETCIPRSSLIAEEVAEEKQQEVIPAQKSGEKPLIPPVSPVIPNPVHEEEDDEITLKLKKLKSLYDKQLISQAEYENKKAEILAQL